MYHMIQFVVMSTSIRLKSHEERSCPFHIRETLASVLFPNDFWSTLLGDITLRFKEDTARIGILYIVHVDNSYTTSNKL